MTAFVSLLSSFDNLPWMFRTTADQPEVGFLAHIKLGGADFHAIAVPVHMVNDLQEALHPENEAELAALFAMLEPGSPFETVKVKGFDCVIHITPFAQ